MATESVWETEVGEIPGVGPVTSKKLESVGVYTVVDLAAKSPAELVQYAGIEAPLATSIIAGAMKLLEESGFIQQSVVTASELIEQRKVLMRCSTGSKNLDELLQGGVETQAITEFFGEFGTGKTQIGHTLCVTSQLPQEEGGFAAKALYIDTENTFRPERVYQIAEARGLEPKKILQGILVARIYNSPHLELLIRQLGSKVRENGIKLIVVDSIISLHRAEFAGRGTLADRQQRLNGIVHALLRVAEIYNCAVVLTNQVQAQPDQFFGDPTKPAGGHILAHAATYRIYLKKAGKERIARMVDSPYHPERETRFIINEAGVADPSNKEKE